MLKVKSKLNNEDLYHTYLSLEVENPQTLNGAPVKLQFVETRNNPILNDAGNYFCSVVRLNLDCWSLPLYIPTIQLNQANPNLTSYVITLRYGGVNNQQTVLWTPENLQATVPPAPLTQQHIVDDYYYGNTYEHFISLINTALATAYTALAPAITAGLGALPANAVGAPFMVFDDNQIVANMYGYQQYYDQNVGIVGPVEIYFNSALFSCFNSLPNEFYSNPSLVAGLVSGMDYKITMKSYYSKNLYNFPAITAPVAPVPVGAYVVAYQQYPTLKLLNPVDSIVFTSNLLPVNPSLVSRPRLYGGFGAFSQNGVGSNNANVTSVLVDFVPEIAYGYESKNLTYSPRSEYKLVDLVGTTQSFNQVDINGFWRDNYGTLHPLYLNQGSNGSILLMFRRKDLGFEKKD